jgi:hypothetical protein
MNLKRMSVCIIRVDELEEDWFLDELEKRMTLL